MYYCLLANWTNSSVEKDENGLRPLSEDTYYQHLMIMNVANKPSEYTEMKVHFWQISDISPRI